jgi:hypothetical protein
VAIYIYSISNSEYQEAYGEIQEQRKYIQSILNRTKNQSTLFNETLWSLAHLVNFGYLYAFHGILEKQKSQKGHLLRKEKRAS